MKCKRITVFLCLCLLVSTSAFSRRKSLMLTHRKHHHKLRMVIPSSIKAYIEDEVGILELYFEAYTAPLTIVLKNSKGEVVYTGSAEGEPGSSASLSVGRLASDDYTLVLTSPEEEMYGEFTVE